MVGEGQKRSRGARVIFSSPQPLSILIGLITVMN